MYIQHDDHLAALLATQLSLYPQQPIPHGNQAPPSHPTTPVRPNTAPSLFADTVPYQPASTPTTSPQQVAPVLQRYSPSQHYYHYTPTAHVAQHFGHHLRQPPADDNASFPQPSTTSQEMADGLPSLHPLQSAFQEGHIFASSAPIGTALGMSNGVMQMEAEPYMSKGYLHGSPSQPLQQGHSVDYGSQYAGPGHSTAAREGDVDMDMS